MKDGIKERFFSSPILSAIAVSLFSVAFLSLPNIFTLQKNLLFAFNIFSRAVVATGAVILAIICGFKPFSKPVLSLSAILLSVLGLMVCVNNFPVIGFATGNVVLTEDPEIFKYICLCISVGVAEEFMFRGFVMPLLSVALKGKKHAPLLTVALSAGIFSFCHLFNIFSAGIPSTLLQVGYTFLTGCLFGAIFLLTENVVFPVILHVVYDIGGLIFTTPFGIAVGNMWDKYTVIITAVLGVIATVIFTVALWKYKQAEDSPEEN